MGKVLSLASFRDGYANLMSRLGMGQDRNTAGVYSVVSLSQQQVEAAYRSSWLTRKVHDLVPFEMTRAGRAWQATAEQIEALEAAETKLQIWHKLRQALTTARLHGGSALVLGVRQGSPDQPLRPEALGANTLRYIFVASRHQLSAPRGFDNNPESDYFGQPLAWEMAGARARVEIHPSRVITFHGSPLPPGSVTMSQLDQFWGDPLLVSIKSAIDNAETSQAAVATLLHEMKQDVISIPNLLDHLATQEGEALIARRIEMVGELKSMFNALLLDAGEGGENSKGGETWETRQLSFAQHPELLRSFVGIVAGAADIPVTRLMGESPGGLQSTGKGEQEDFNRSVDAKRDADLSGPLARLDEVLIPSTLGSRPPEIYYEFGPLSAADPSAAATIEKTEAETIKIYTDTNLIPVDALAKAVANRLNESGRFPGLDKAIEESAQELGEAKLKGQEAALNPPEPANENDVRELEARGAVTRDQALTLLADAAPRSLYVSRKLLNPGEVRAWAAKAGLEITVPDDKLHVTVMSSRVPVDWMKFAGYPWNDGDDGKLTIAPGGPRILDRLGGGIVLMFGSNSLVYRHEDMRREGAEFSHPGDYQPHITLAYDAPEPADLSALEPYRGRLVFGPEIFEEFVETWRP